MTRSERWRSKHIEASGITLPYTRDDEMNELKLENKFLTSQNDYLKAENDKLDKFVDFLLEELKRQRINKDIEDIKRKMRDEL